MSMTRGRDRLSKEEKFELDRCERVIEKGLNGAKEPSPPPPPSVRTIVIPLDADLAARIIVGAFNPDGLVRLNRYLTDVIRVFGSHAFSPLPDPAPAPDPAQSPPIVSSCQGKRKKPASKEEEEKILELRRQDISIQLIAKKVGRSYSFVQKICAKAAAEEPRP